jgi:hypothetical protein
LVDESNAPPFITIVDNADEVTAKVRAQIEEELSKMPSLAFLRGQFGSYLFNAAQRLIDLKHKTGVMRPRDEAIAISIPRLFTECHAADDLARSGRVLQAIVLLRSAFEIGTQTIAFMHDDDLASKWLADKRIEPKEVRALLDLDAEGAAEYTRLARLSHPNFQARWLYSFLLRAEQPTSTVAFSCLSLLVLSSPN